MSSEDKIVGNDTFPNVRQDINNQLAAIASQQADTGNPPAMVSYERQARTDMGVSRRRNAANTNWILDGTLAETLVIARSSNTVLTLANHLCKIIATSTFTQTIDAVSTLPDGWCVDYRNDGTGVITIDPNSSETIDGATTLELYPGESCVIVCNGSAFKTIGRHSSSVKVKAETRDMTLSSGNVAYTGYGFKPKWIEVHAVKGATSAISWGFSDGTANLSTYDDPASAGTYQADAHLINLLQSAGVSQQASVSSFDADGYTLTWTKAGSPTGTANLYVKAGR